MEKETTRVEAFSDGVFGIALTLLILGIKVPDLKQSGLFCKKLPKQIKLALMSQIIL